VAEIAYYEPLTHEHVEELMSVLLNEQVYQYIGGVPSAADFCEELLNSIAGPSVHCRDQAWLYFVSRCAASRKVVGQLEATLHNGIAEVGFVFSPSVWGRGFAEAGLRWLHQHVWRMKDGCELWATTHPSNVWSSRLLERCGYMQVAAPADGSLLTYEPGDLAYQLKVRPNPSFQVTPSAAPELQR
jgi:RimJ/RimL family protein N-acetyltransferase